MTATSTMRVYLNVPFAEKDDAKQHGARWDPVCAKWWINRHDIATHPGIHRWIIDNAALAARAKAAFDFIERKPPAKPNRVNSKPPVATRASNFLLPTCACSTPPWDHCDHTITAGQA